MTLIDFIGAAGAVLFATACFPMAWKTVKIGKSIGTPAATVWTFVGATFSFGVYLGAKVGWYEVPTILIYSEFLCWSTALWYHYFPRKPPFGGWSSAKVEAAFNAASKRPADADCYRYNGECHVHGKGCDR